MQGKELYSMSKLCGDCKRLCSKNMNRILEKISLLNNKEAIELVSDFAKLSIVMDYLCSYVSNLCCNEENLSKFIISELKNKCKKMIDLLKKIKKVLKNEKNSTQLIKYIRCDEIISICTKIHSKCK